MVGFVNSHIVIPLIVEVQMGGGTARYFGGLSFL